MKKLVILFPFFVIIFGCQTHCLNSDIEKANLWVDLSDTSITQVFYGDTAFLVTKIFPKKMERCQQLVLLVGGIGGSIENKESMISYPSTGPIEYKVGNYELDDLNTQKVPFLLHATSSAINSMTLPNKNSQIWYTLQSLLKKSDLSGPVFIYSDLLEHYGGIDFYKPFDNEKALAQLWATYGEKPFKSTFKGDIFIISPLGKWQQQVFKARAFYADYFQSIGLSPQQVHFLGSVSQLK